MKKKGFTLVELLAVIVVLAIIAVIAVPIVLNVISKSKKGAAIDSAYSYVDAVEKYIVMHDMDETKYPIDLKSGEIYQVSNNTYTETSFLNVMEKVYAEDNIILNDIISIKGTKPNSGIVAISEKRKVGKAILIIDNYKIICEKGICNIDGNTIDIGNISVKKHSVIVNKGKGILDTVGSGQYEQGESVSISYTLEDGYEFDSVTGDFETTTFNMPDSDVEITVNGKAIVYTITYNLNGGNANNPTNYTIETENITLENPTKDGSEFIGWSGTDLDGNTNMSVTISEGSIGNRSYIANFEIKSCYKVSDNKNFEAYYENGVMKNCFWTGDKNGTNPGINLNGSGTECNAGRWVIGVNSSSNMCRNGDGSQMLDDLCNLSIGRRSASPGKLPYTYNCDSNN